MKKRNASTIDALMALAFDLFRAPDAMAKHESRNHEDLFLMGPNEKAAFFQGRDIGEAARITGINERTKERMFGKSLRAFNDLASGDNLIAALRTFAVSMPENQQVQAERELFAPDVEVDDIRFDYTDYSGGLTGWEYDTLDERAINGDFKKLKDQGTEVTKKLPERGIATDIDAGQYKDIGKEAQRRLKLIMKRMELNALRRTIAGLVAIMANSAKTWDGTAGQDPDSDMIKHITTGYTATGVRANVGLIAADAWSWRVTTLRAQGLTAAGLSANATPEEVARFLGLRTLMVSQTAQMDGANAISQVLAGKALFAQVAAEASTADASIMKTFWTAHDGSRRNVAPLRQVGDRIWRLAVWEYSKQVVSGPATNTVRGLTITGP